MEIGGFTQKIRVDAYKGSMHQLCTSKSFYKCIILSLCNIYVYIKLI
jgi:hypothetical protein